MASPKRRSPRVGRKFPVALLRLERHWEISTDQISSEPRWGRHWFGVRRVAIKRSDLNQKDAEKAGYEQPRSVLSTAG
jgi:hypothetical protein